MSDTIKADLIKLNSTKMYENPDIIEYEEDYVNEDPTALMQESPSDEFDNYMTTQKKKLYLIIVFGPEDPESDLAQDPKLLEKYINKLYMLGKSIIKIITNPTGLILEEELKYYSSDIKNLVKDTLNYTNTFLKYNSNINKMTYIDHIKNIFNVYPFFQLGYFPK